MEIGDIVTVITRVEVKQPNATTLSRIFKGDGNIPHKGRIEYMGERFATLMMLSSLDEELYRESFFLEELMEARHGH